jgi:hypothetical protein
MKELLDRLFSQHHSIDVAEINKLNTKEIDILREMVLGTLTSPNRIKAFDIFSATAAPDKVEILIKVLYNREESIPVRAAAVYHLGRTGHLEVEQALLSCLTTESNQLLLAKIVKNIGFSGSEKAIAALQRLEKESEGFLKRQTTFSRLFIGHRLGLKDFIPVVTNENKYIQPAHGVSIPRLREVEEKKHRALSQLLAVEGYGLHLKGKVAGEFKCAGRELVLLLNESVIKESSLTLLQRPALLGALALWSEESKSYSVYRWILAGPSANERFYIAIYKASGLLLHYGLGNIKEKGYAELEIRSLDTLGNAAIDVKAVLKNADLSFERFILSPVLHRKKAPRRYYPQ